MVQYSRALLPSQGRDISGPQKYGLPADREKGAPAGKEAFAGE